MFVRVGGNRVAGAVAAMALMMCSAQAFAAPPEVFTYDGLVEGAGTPVTTGTYGTSGSNSTYTVTGGATVQLEVFLQSSFAPASSLLQSSEEDGIFGAGTTLSVSSGTGTLTNATITFATNASGSSPFIAGFDKSSITSSALTFAETQNNEPEPMDGVPFKASGSPSDTGASQVYLGTITLTAPASGSTVYHLGETLVNGIAGNQTLTDTNGEDLDTGATNGGTNYGFTPVGSQFTSITLSVAPEPSSLGLLAVAGLFALKRRRIA